MEESPSTSRMGDALSGYRRQASENLHSTSDRLKGAYGRFKVSKKMKLILSVIIVGILACAATIATTIAVTVRKAKKNESLATETAVPTSTILTIEGTSTTQVPKSTEFPAAPELDTTSTVPPPSNGSPALVLNNCVDNGMISLTFDDGPSTNVPAVLQVLNELNTKATFFVNAKNIADFTSPDSATASILKTIYDGGHQVGTHTMSHADLAKISRLQRWEQMRRNDEYIKRIIGVRPVHLRAPFLSVSPAMLRDIGSWGYVVAGVSLDTKDYSFPRPNLLKNMADTVAPSMANANPDQISFIVLQHDFVSGGQEWLRSFVPDMQQRGFRFVTSEECLKVTAYR